MQGVVPAQPLEASASSVLPSSRDDHSVQDSGPRGFGSVIKSKEAVICVALGSQSAFIPIALQSPFQEQRQVSRVSFILPSL